MAAELGRQAFMRAPAGPVPLASSVSDLAEELAALIELNGRTINAAELIDRRIKAHALAWHRRPMDLTLEVAREWDRLGISRMLTQFGPLGDGQA